MLKYNDIISQLSDGDKINILCDIKNLSDKQYRVLGIPRMNISSFEEMCKGEIPSPTALANTWDTELIKRVAESVCSDAIENGVDVITLPTPKIKINPYRSAMTEDPYLACEIIHGFAATADRENISFALDDYSIHRDEIEWLDDVPDKRFISEYVVAPSIESVSSGKCTVVFKKTDIHSANYENINTELVNEIAPSLSESTFTVYKKVSGDDTVRCVNRGDLFLEGSSIALEVALTRYKQIKKGIEQASATAEDLKYEISQGKATSPELLDAAVDKLLELAFTAKRRTSVSEMLKDEDVGYKATSEATVLLKNENALLPVKKGIGVCIIGEIAIGNEDREESFENELAIRFAEEGYTFNGYARGYGLFSDRTPELIPEAVELAEKSDVVLLFLGLDSRRTKRSVKDSKISIPANQQELLDVLGQKAHGKVVAILPAESMSDICMPEKCSAMLMSPMSTISSAGALFDILTGKVSPSGKLASTLYCKTESLYARHIANKKRDKLKSGCFIGYRYYDIANTPPEFPFGHGLSYTSFAYSNISVTNDTVSFKVTNKGSVGGAEVAQVYIGKNDSAVLRPQKELCGFARVVLEAGESATVQIPISIPKVYDKNTNAYVVEGGEYSVSVGASVCDIRLMQSFNVSGQTIVSDGEKLSNYIQTVSNIKSDNFKLEAKYKKMKKSVFNYIAGAVALLLGIVLKLYCVYSGTDSWFFDLFSVVLGCAGVAYLVAELARRGHEHNEERKAVDELSKNEFADADTVPVYSAGQMFVKEFDTNEEEEIKVEEEKTEGVDAELLAYVDKDQTFESAARDFEIFARERGYKFDTDTVRSIFASLASSRLIVVSGMDSASYRNLIMLLGNYFDTAAYIDRVDSTYDTPDSVLFHDDAQSGRTATNVFKAIEAGRNIKHGVHFAALDNVITAYLPAYIAPYVNYAKNPLANCHVTVRNERYVESTYYIPQNLWFILNLADGESPDRLPEFMSDVAVTVKLGYKDVEAAEKHTEIKRFTYYQMEHLTEKVVSRISVPEEVWKKIDRLEENVSAKSDGFALGNKMWLCLEKFAYVYIACGGDINDALDRAISAKLMATIVSALKSSPSGFDRSLGETVETILGDGNAYACQKFINDCAAV